MKLKSIVTALMLGQLSLAGVSYSQLVNAQSSVESVKEEVKKGPNNGRMLQDGDFAIELAIFEDGMPPEFRVFASKGKTKLAAKDINLNVKLTRLGGVVDDINFFVENDYLRGDMEIYEPHSFQVTLTATYANKTHQWSYDNFEGRTEIKDDMANAMQIETEFVESQTFNETLTVFGKLKLAANAVRHITARFPGEVVKLHAELGQQVNAGTNLARLAKSGEFLAELRVPEQQVSNVSLGQQVLVDTKANTVAGIVKRIDPSVINGSVQVDVALVGPIPKEARPELSVDGIIEIANLSDVLFVKRPMFAKQNSNASVFSFDAIDNLANLTSVEFGKVSSTHIEIKQGLSAGDRIVVSDVSSWDGHQQITLN